MDGQPTRAGGTLSLPTAWRTWAAFLRHPAAPPRADLSPGPALRELIPLFALDLLVMGALMGAMAAAMAAGFEMPGHMLGEMTLSPLLIGFIVIGAPIGEEIVFRGWLSGRRGHVIACALAIAAAIALAMGGGAAAGGNMAVTGAILAGAIGALALAALAIYRWRDRDAPAWYRRHFGWFFYLSAAAFAAIHLGNFTAAGPAMLPMVLPQLMLALILGFVRVRRGLWSSVLLHALHNSLFIGIVVLAGG